MDASMARYLKMLDTADRQEDEVAEMRISWLSERLEALRRQMRELWCVRIAGDCGLHRSRLLVVPRQAAERIRIIAKPQVARVRALVPISDRMGA